MDKNPHVLSDLRVHEVLLENETQQVNLYTQISEKKPTYKPPSLNKKKSLRKQKAEKEEREREKASLLKQEVLVKEH